MTYDQESDVGAGAESYRRLVALAVEDAVDRVQRNHPDADPEVLRRELAGELRLAGLPEEDVRGERFSRALAGLLERVEADHGHHARTVDGQASTER